MSWADKALKKAKQEKLIQEIMNTQAYKEEKKKDQMQTFSLLCFVACDFLEEHHRYGQKGLLKFLDFANKRMQYIAQDNENYIDEMNEYFLDKYGFDILAGLGLKGRGERVGTL